MSSTTDITTNGTTKAFTTSYDCQGVSVIVTATSVLSGGSLDMMVRPARSNTAWEIVERLLPGQKDGFLVGKDMEIAFLVADAETPNIRLIIAEV